MATDTDKSVDEPQKGDPAQYLVRQLYLVAMQAAQPSKTDEAVNAALRSVHEKVLAFVNVVDRAIQQSGRDRLYSLEDGYDKAGFSENYHEKPAQQSAGTSVGPGPIP